MTQDVLERLRQEIAVATFADGGLLVHLASGDIFRLDATAAAIWRALSEEAHLDRAVRSIGLALGLTPDEARLTADASVKQALAIEKSPPRETYRIEDRDGWISLAKERPLLVFHRQSLMLALHHRPDPAHPKEEDDIPALIRLFVPKILATWFPLAMHASALEIADHALLFSGPSGAGKTTTARTLAGAIDGARLLSEDVVLFATVGDVSTIVDGAEPIIHAWLQTAAARLLESPTATVGAQSLGQALEEQHHLIPLRKIVFLDASRRKGTSWSLRRLERAQALGALFLNSFLPSGAPEWIRHHLGVCRAVASGAHALEATTIPASVDGLREGSRAQSEMIAS